MIVIGADTHKRSHTVAAVEAASGRVLAERTVPARRRSFEACSRWARGHGGERVWAIEDCRHVSGALERFLLARGEARRARRAEADRPRAQAARERGKSDAIDAVAIARAALREGLETLPVAQLAGPELDVRLLVDHRERLVAQRTALSNDLRWHLHDLWPETEIPPRALSAAGWQTRIAGRLARAEQTARVRIARDELRRIRELTRTINDLEAELADARRRARAAAARRTRLRRPDRRQAARRDRRRRPASPPTPSSPAPPARHRSPPPPDAPNATASTAAATARSTARCTASPSPKAASTPRPPPTSPAAKPKARPAAKPSAASSATSPAASGTSSNPTPRPPSPPALPTRPARIITIHCNRPTGTPQLT